MSWKCFDVMYCSVVRIFDQVGDWWFLLIVCDVMFGVCCFVDFEVNLGIVKNIFSDCFKWFIEDEIFE